MVFSFLSTTRRWPDDSISAAGISSIGRGGLGATCGTVSAIVATRSVCRAPSRANTIRFASSTKNADGSCAVTVDVNVPLASNTAMPLLNPSRMRLSGSIFTPITSSKFDLSGPMNRPLNVNAGPFGARTCRRYRIELMLSAASASRLAGIICRTRCTSGSAAAARSACTRQIAGGKIRPRRPRRARVRRRHPAIAHQRLFVTTDQPKRFARVKARGGNGVVTGEQSLDALEARHGGVDIRRGAPLRHRDAPADDVGHRGGVGFGIGLQQLIDRRLRANRGPGRRRSDTARPAAARCRRRGCCGNESMMAWKSLSASA